VLRFPLPVVAAVNGAALAGGFDLAVLADLRVAADVAFFAHVEHTFGDVVYRPLRDLVGGSVARDLVLTGRRIEAGEALAVGLVNRVVPAADLLETAVGVAADIALAPREFLVRTKAKIIAAAGISPILRTLDL
jgi:enoyl-CoA hydratase